MTQAPVPGGDARAPIHISPADHETLSRLVGDQPGEGVAGLLQQELERAVLCEDADRPAGVVGLNHWLTYRDDRSDRIKRVMLVTPALADIDTGRVSVLSHVGAGLIGLTEGRSIDWTDPSGAERVLTVVAVEAAD